MQTSSPYQVIARRWRPKKFSDLVGQDHIVKTLSNAIDLNKIAHAYLFVGQRGTGKTSTARLFAMAINAKNKPDINFDLSDETSIEIMNGSCMDVIEIDGASNNSVDQIRNLREECQYAPAKCRFKVYIIDEVHMLSTSAFNALLKTLEEPPQHVKFIFATTESYKVLPTILSRCQRFEFRPISQEIITKKLSEICETEHINASNESLKLIAKISNGGMRDAQSILDQMVAFSDNTITEKDIIEIYGLVSNDILSELRNAIFSSDYKYLIDFLQNNQNSNCDYYKILCNLEDNIMDSLSNNDKESSEQKIRVLDIINSYKSKIGNGLSDKINFEITLLKSAETAKSRPIDLIISMIKQRQHE